MEREQHQGELIELGIASTDTQGHEVGSIPEPKGLYFPGLSDD